MPDFQCLPLPAASDFGQGFLMSAESPQIPGAHRAFAGGSAFPGRSPPCRTGRRARPRHGTGNSIRMGARYTQSRSPQTGSSPRRYPSRLPPETCVSHQTAGASGAAVCTGCRSRVSRQPGASQNRYPPSNSAGGTAPGASRYSSAAGSLFSSSKPTMPHFKAEPGGNGYRIMDKPPFL